MLPLDPTDEQAQPAFKDPASCQKWLSQLQLTNLALAQGALRKQIDELNRYPLRAKERLQIMEALREIVATVQGDYIRKLFGKKLPLADDEFSTLLALAALWQSMLNGYLRCLQASDGGDTSVAAGERALLAQRSMLYSSLQLGDFLRMGYEPDTAAWQRFHRIYAHFESHGLHLQAVADPYAGSGRPLSCRTLYVKTLLLQRARLISLTRAQWLTVERWLELWGSADTFSVEPRFTISKGDAPPLAVDLDGNRGLMPVDQAPPSPSMRYLALVPLSKLIRVKTILLQQGQSPAQVELGGELDSRACIDLLNRLHARWCEKRPESLADMPREAPLTQLCSNLEDIYGHIARKPFKKPSSSGISEKDVQKQIETFGRVLDETDRHVLSELGFLAEDWLVEEDGLLHAHLLRRNGGARLGQNQLVCTHRPDAASYKAGVVTLACVTRSGQLYVSLRYLPGVPQAIVIRASGSDNLQSGSAAALLLPEMANLRIPASLILPRDWFHAGRELELTLPDGKKQKVALGISVEKGNDYERVSFSPL